MKDPARALLLHSLRFDWLEAGPESGATRLYSGALFGFLLSGLIAASLASVAAATALPILYSVIALIAFVGILSDIGGTFLDPRDVALLRTLPVSDAQYFRARVTALAVGIVHQTLSFGLIPAVLYSSGPRGPWWAFAPFLLTTFLMLAVLSGAAVLVFLGLQRFLDPSRIRDLLVWVQVILFVASTAGWLFLFGADVGGESLGAVTTFQHVGLPSSWFAGLHLFLIGGTLPTAVHGVLALASPLVLVVWLALLAPRYLDVLKALEKPAGAATWVPPWRAWFERLFVGPPERPTFRLGLALIRRERTFRIQSYPLLAYGLVFLTFGQGDDESWLFSLFFSHFAAMALPLAALFLRYSDHAPAGWVLAANASVSREELWYGARKALFYATVIPLYVCITGVLVVYYGWFVGVSNGVLAFCLGGFVATSGPIPEDGLPFSDKFTGGLVAERIKDRVFILMVMIVALGFGQSYLWGQWRFGVPLVALAGLVVLGLHLRRPAATKTPLATIRWQGFDEVPQRRPFRVVCRPFCERGPSPLGVVRRGRCRGIVDGLRVLARRCRIDGAGGYGGRRSGPRSPRTPPCRGVWDPRQIARKRWTT